MREILSAFLANQARSDRDFFVLSGDHGYALFDRIRQEAPGQFINLGVTEQAMVGCAAGLAKTGKKVCIYGLSAFLPLRVLEFVKLSVCFEGLPVIMLGDGAGAVYTTLGVSHQCAEDVACLRPLPVKIFAPADDHEMQYCLERALQERLPSYIRIGKAERPRVHANPLALSGPLFQVRESTGPIALLAMGSMVSTACELAEGSDISVFSCPELSFFDRDAFAQTLANYKWIVTVEEHSIYGGLGSVVGDVILEHQLPVRLTKCGMEKTFTRGAGSYEYAMQFHGLDVKSLRRRMAGLGIGLKEPPGDVG